MLLIVLFLAIGRNSDIIFMGDKMTLQELIEKNNYTIYRFSKESLVPKTTLIDLCSGKSSIQRSQAITIKKIADALGVTMETIMLLDNPNNDYLECNLPEFLIESINNYKRNSKTIRCDIYYSTLQSDINVAEVEGFITPNQAWYLRGKYLGYDKND